MRRWTALIASLAQLSIPDANGDASATAADDIVAAHGHPTSPIRIIEPKLDEAFLDHATIGVHVDCDMGKTCSDPDWELGTFIAPADRGHDKVTKDRQAVPRACFIGASTFSLGQFVVIAELRSISKNKTIAKRHAVFSIKKSVETYLKELHPRITDWDSYATLAIMEGLDKKVPPGFVDKILLPELAKLKMPDTRWKRSLLHHALRAVEANMVAKHNYVPGQGYNTRWAVLPEPSARLLREVLPHAALGLDGAKTALEGLDSVDCMGYTALHYATTAGMHSVMRMLLDGGADPNVRAATWRAETALHLAIIAEDAQAVAILSSSPATDVNVADGLNRSPLEVATTLGFKLVAKQLLHANALCTEHAHDSRLNATYGRSQHSHPHPLVRAVLHANRTAIDEILQRAGATKPVDGLYSAFRMAVLRGSHNIAVDLLDAGAKCDSATQQASKSRLEYSPMLSATVDGWNMDVTAELTTDRYDVPIVHKSELTSERWMRDYMSLMRPVMVKGTTEGWGATKNWGRDKLVEKYGHEPIITSRIPHGYGRSVPEFVPMRDHIRYMQGNATNETMPLYSFDLWVMDKGLKPDINIDYDQFVGMAEHQSRSTFILGSKRSGTPMHHHCSVINVSIFGRKRWFLLPPSVSFIDSEHPYEWLNHGDPARSYQQYANRSRVLEVIQEPGDTLHIPAFWGHAVINLEDTVAIAYEYNPGYCQLSHFTSQEF